MDEPVNSQQSTDFESATEKLRVLTESPSAPVAPTLSLLVIETKDIEATLQFYNLLGLNFVSEKHGAGPIHYAATLGTLVFEIYPCRNARPATTVRLGFQIPAVDDTLELLRKRGARIISEPKDTPWGRRAVVEDPNGNGVELMAQVKS
jgi:lactoylglutathione lyase